MTPSYPTIAIDGPAGAGKSTVALELARRLGFLLLDTGAIYRTLALSAIRSGIALQDERALARHAENLNIRLATDQVPARVFLSNQDVTDAIRSLEVATATSMIAGYATVRQVLLPLQRKLAAQGPCVVEGRDIGTVVLPTASVKIFLTASSTIRAKRRQQQLEAKGQKVDFSTVLNEQESRDFRDSHREIAPSLPADDALVFDSSTLTLIQVIDQLELICKKSLAR